jgi:hypothetical protein
MKFCRLAAPAHLPTYPLLLFMKFRRYEYPHMPA